MSNDAPIDGEDVIRATSPKSAMLLLYDWFKHMTTLSLVTLGGLLSILQASKSNVRPGALAGIVITIALAGIIGFAGQSRIIKAELSGAAAQNARLVPPRRSVELRAGNGDVSGAVCGIGRLSVISNIVPCAEDVLCSLGHNMPPEGLSEAAA